MQLRASVIGAFCLFVTALGGTGFLAITAALRSVQQAATFQSKSLIPVVGLGVLSQNVDQQRDLLSRDTTVMSPDHRRAVQSELSSLDVTISTTASRILLRQDLPQWQSVWSRYLDARKIVLRGLLFHTHDHVSAATRNRLSNRLDSVLDVVQRDAGIRLYMGQRRYVGVVNDDATLIRIAFVDFGLSLLLGLIIATLIVRRVTFGLRNLVTTAAAITHGDLDVRADARGSDELSVIARAFNHMTDALLRLEKTALTDPLTSLGNHRAFHEEFRRELGRAIRHGDPFSLALIDLDDFKSINDHHGHAHGDRVLADLAVCLRQTRVEDRAFRIGGDEFALLLPYADEETAMSVVERLRIRVSTVVPGSTISAGVAQLESGMEDGETLRDQADAALYESKRRGRNAVVSFESIKHQAQIVSPARIQAVRELMAEEKFSFAFQPIWNLDLGTLLGFEALMRPSPDTGLASPQEVFDIAEKLGRIPELDELCLTAILGRVHDLPSDAQLFINLSPQSLDSEHLKSGKLLETIHRAGISPSRVVFEITERSISRVDMVVREARRLRELGFKLALDDVGAGNAGLDMLRQVAVDYVKIDRSVIGQALIDHTAAAVLSAIVAFATRAHTFVIAEGIETQAMLDIVREVGVPDPSIHAGVEGVQGYLLGRPSEHIDADPLTDDVIVSYEEFLERHRTGA